MTERLADITAHIDSVRQLGAVVNALRGIAGARAQQARSQLVAVDAYTQTISAAIGRALPLIANPGGAGGRRSARRALVLFCAEQGFAGDFSEHVLDAAGGDLTGAEVFLIGGRGAAGASERGVPVAWTTGAPAHSAGIPKLADRIAEALYSRIATGDIDRLDAIFSRWRLGESVAIERQCLIPLDVSAFASPSTGGPPLVNLAPGALLDALTADYVHAQLCKAALHTFAAENQARMEAMAAAHNQIDHRLAALSATLRRVRQENITAEIIELAAGETASRQGAHS